MLINIMVWNRCPSPAQSATQLVLLLSSFTLLYVLFLLSSTKRLFDSLWFSTVLRLFHSAMPVSYTTWNGCSFRVLYPSWISFSLSFSPPSIVVHCTMPCLTHPQSPLLPPNMARRPSFLSYCNLLNACSAFKMVDTTGTFISVLYQFTLV